ncbi:MAG: hypothetical protein ACYC9R_06320 [Nitrosotalea sp.]
MKEAKSFRVAGQANKRYTPPTKAERRLASRIRDYDAMSSEQQKAMTRPGSLQRT